MQRAQEEHNRRQSEARAFKALDVAMAQHQQATTRDARQQLELALRNCPQASIAQQPARLQELMDSARAALQTLKDREAVEDRLQAAMDSQDAHSLRAALDDARAGRVDASHIDRATSILQEVQLRDQVKNTVRDLVASGAPDAAAIDALSAALQEIKLIEPTSGLIQQGLETLLEAKSRQVGLNYARGRLNSPGLAPVRAPMQVESERSRKEPAVLLAELGNVRKARAQYETAEVKATLPSPVCAQPLCNGRGSPH
eukprot:3952101-Prymnesium_polylepis.1